MEKNKNYWRVVMSVKTVQDAWMLYKDTTLYSLKKGGQVTEKGRWNNYIAPVLGEVKIHELTKFDYLKLKKSLEKKELSPQTIHHALSLLRRMLNNAVEWGEYQGEIPNFKKILPKFDNKRLRFLSNEEARKLFFCLEPHKEWYDISMFALNTGLRRGELFSLSFSNVNFHERLVYIVDTKTNKNRVVPLNDTAFEILNKKIN